MTDVKRKVVCPECDKEVELVNGEGSCAACGLDVGWVLEKRRRDKAIEKLKQREEAELNPPKPGKGKKFEFGL